MLSINNNLPVNSNKTPFEYYSIGFSSSNGKTTLQKIETFSKEFFRNIFYTTCNAVILGANTLRLYKLIPAHEVKMEATLTKCQIAAFALQALKSVNLISPALNTYPVLNTNTISNLLLIRDSVSKDKFSFVKEIIKDSIPVLTLFNQSANTYRIAKRSCKALLECWTLSHKNPSAAAKHALVHSSNLLFSISHLYSNALWHLNILKLAPYFNEAFNTAVDSYNEYGDEYQNSEEFIEKSQKIGNDIEEFTNRAFLDKKRCNNYFLNLRSFGKSEEGKIESLDPTCFQDAKNMIFDKWISDPCSMRDIKKNFHKKSIKHHPDKGGDNNLMARLTKAKETVERECSFPERHAKYSLKKFLTERNLLPDWLNSMLSYI